MIINATVSSFNTHEYHYGKLLLDNLQTIHIYTI